MKKISALLISVLVLLLISSGLTLAESNSEDLETMPESTSGSSFLEEEAGITAYTKVDSVDLSQVKNAFKNIETETDEYVVGSVAIADYREESDVHVYVDTSGWIAAYYLKKEPASKIIDWRHYDTSTGASTTKLERAMVVVTDALGTATPLPYTKYCDFRYPDAKRIMIATDEVIERNATESFRIKIPSTFTVYSRSWSHYGIGTYDVEWVRLKIDGTLIHEGDPDQYPNMWKIWQGSLSPSQLSLGTYHKISTGSEDNDYSSYVGIALVYSQ